jgi:hypothetical protein
LRKTPLIISKAKNFIPQSEIICHLKVLADIRVLFPHLLVHVVDDAKAEGVFHCNLLLGTNNLVKKIKAPIFSKNKNC